MFQLFLMTILLALFERLLPHGLLVDVQLMLTSDIGARCVVHCHVECLEWYSWIKRASFLMIKYLFKTFLFAVYIWSVIQSKSARKTW